MVAGGGDVVAGVVAVGAAGGLAGAGESVGAPLVGVGAPAGGLFSAPFSGLGVAGVAEVLALGAAGALWALTVLGLRRGAAASSENETKTRRSIGSGPTFGLVAAAVNAFAAQAEMRCFSRVRVRARLESPRRG